MSFVKDLLKEKSDVSAMRFMSLICCISAVTIAAIGILGKVTPDYSGLSILCGTFLGAGLGGKVMQKSIETKAMGVKTEETETTEETK